MSDNQQNLIKEILIFLEKERTMYGDFAIDSIHRAADSGEVSIGSNPDTQSPAAGEEINPGTDENLHVDKLEEQLKKCTNLDELKKYCSESPDLKTDMEGTNLVFGTGNENADLMIIGEAPGYYEDQQGEPFVGKAGQLLNKILEAIEFRREDVYIANILKHRPPKNRNPKPEERDRSLPYLERQIEIVDPKLILSLGRVSATALLKRDDSLGNMRGKFHPFMKRQLMVTYHPAALLRNPQWKRATWEDVQLLKEKYTEMGCRP